MKKWALLALAGTTLLSACQHKTSLNSYYTDQAEQALLDAASSVEQSLRTLAAQDAQPNQVLMDITPLVTSEARLGQTATLDWSGPVEPIIEKIANVADYRFRILGKTPSIPVMISLTHQRAMLAEILKDIQLQSSKQAEIMVFPETHTIELRYRQF